MYQAEASTTPRLALLLGVLVLISLPQIVSGVATLCFAKRDTTGRLLFELDFFISLLQSVLGQTINDTQTALMHSSNMLTIGLDDGLQLVYLAEGAANVVYKIRSLPLDPSTSADLHFERYGPNTPPPTEIEPLTLDPHLEGKLVRLRKKTSSPTSVAESQNHFEDTIKPLFPPQNLVQQILFRPSTDLLKDCNAALREMETTGTRPAKRHAVYLAEDEPHGMLVTDMSCDNNDDDSFNKRQLFEFKPKWLAQSPTAPPDSKRCRTCALRAMKKGSKQGLCPLHLLNEDNVTTAVCRIMRLDPPHPHPQQQQQQEETDYGGGSSEEMEVLRGRIRDFFLTDPLLSRLRNLQMDSDPVGVLNAAADDPGVRAAMTLRDCTLFIRVGAEEGSVEARLGDLDLKSGEGKVGYWRGLERRLVEGGWYTATEKETTAVVGERFCQLALMC